jgi:hypothetical protein
MKAAMNGALHLSTLEGWWKEGFNDKNGWAITAGSVYDKPDLQDMADANQLYDLLEHEIAVLYYDRNEADIPEIWVRMMKDSLVSVCRDFNINRTLCDYLSKCYTPSMQASTDLSKDDFQPLKTAAEEEKDVMKYWDIIKITSFSTDLAKKSRLTKGDTVNTQCSVRFGPAPIELFTVELFYMLDNNSRFKIISTQLQNKSDGSADFTCSFKIEDYGLQNINIRIKPANKIVQDLHPELVKWAE